MQKYSKNKEKKGRKPDPQMTNETRKVRKNHNLKSHPYVFNYRRRQRDVQ